MADQENITDIQDNNIDNNQELNQDINQENNQNNKNMDDYQNTDVQEINEQENNINENKIENETLQENDESKKNMENAENANSSVVDGQTQDQKNEEGKIFVGGLNFETTDENLRKYFSQFGELTDCIIMRTDNGMSRCFGFLTFKDPATIDVVLKQQHTLDGKKIDPKPAIPREEQEKTEKIFVGGVGLDVTEEEFKEYFSQFGKVVESTLMSNKDTGRPRGFGFITFESEESAKAVLAKRKEIVIKDKLVEVKEALPKSKTKPNHMSRRNPYMGMDQRRSYAGPIRNSRSMNDPRYVRGGYNNGMVGYNRDYGNRSSRGGYYGYGNSNSGYGYNGYDNMNMYYKGGHGNSSSTSGNQQNYSFGGYNTRYQYNNSQGYGYSGRVADSTNSGSYSYNSGYNSSRVGNINGYSSGASNPNMAGQQSQSRNSHSYHPYAH